MVGIKQKATIDEVQEALDEFYPEDKWVALGSTAYNKGCLILAQDGVMVGSFLKNWNALDAITDPRTSLKKRAGLLDLTVTRSLQWYIDKEHQIIINSIKNVNRLKDAVTRITGTKTDPQIKTVGVEYDHKC